MVCKPTFITAQVTAATQLMPIRVPFRDRLPKQYPIPDGRFITPTPRSNYLFLSNALIQNCYDDELG